MYQELPISLSLIHIFIAFLTAITIVLGMRMMGALLISSLIVFPSLTAMQLCRQFKTTIIPVSYTHLDVYKRQDGRSRAENIVQRFPYQFHVAKIGQEENTTRVGILFFGNCLLYTSRCV